MQLFKDAMGGPEWRLRLTRLFLAIHPINKPEVLVEQTQTEYNGSRPIDEATRAFICYVSLAVVKVGSRDGRWAAAAARRPHQNGES
jgi:hypothetical protein